jgi:hypothetical protein
MEGIREFPRRRWVPEMSIWLISYSEHRLTPYSRCGGQAPLIYQGHFEEVDSGKQPATPNRIAGQTYGP